MLGVSNAGAMSERLDNGGSTRVLGALQHRDKLYLQNQVDHGAGSVVGTIGRPRDRRGVGAPSRKGQGLGSTRSVNKKNPGV